MTTLATFESQEILNQALDSFLGAINEDQAPQCLYKLQYKRLEGSTQSPANGSIFGLSFPSTSLSFDDSILRPVRDAWKMVMGDAAVDAEYMQFTDREGAAEDDDV